MTKHRHSHTKLTFELSLYVPNEETLKVFKETDERKNLIRYKSTDDLIDQLDFKAGG